MSITGQFCKTWTQRYPLDSAIRLSYNRPLVSTPPELAFQFTYWSRTIPKHSKPTHNMRLLQNIVVCLWLANYLPMPVAEAQFLSNARTDHYINSQSLYLFGTFFVKHTHQIKLFKNSLQEKHSHFYPFTDSKLNCANRYKFINIFRPSCCEQVFNVE